MDTHVPINVLTCPISNCVMAEPVIACDGICYEASCIAEHLEKSNTSPITLLPIHNILIPNKFVKQLIDEFIIKYPDHIHMRYRPSYLHSSNKFLIKNFIIIQDFDKLLQYSNFRCDFLFEDSVLVLLLQNCKNDNIIIHVINNMVDLHYQSNITGDTLMHFVCRYGTADIIKKAIDLFGVNIMEYKNINGVYPIQNLCKFQPDLVSTVQYLIEKGVSYEKEDNKGARLIHYLCIYCPSIDLINFLLIQRSAYVERYADYYKLPGNVSHPIDCIRLNKRLSDKQKDYIISKID